MKNQQPSDLPLRRSWFYVSLLRVIRPVAAARMSNHLPLWNALVGHVILASIAFVACITSVALLGPDYQHQGLSTIQKLLKPWFELWNEIERRPQNAIGVGLFLGFIELAFVVTALCVVACGARDEPLRRSFAHAFRQTWLHTINIAVFAILCACFINMTESVRHEFNRRIESKMAPYPQPPKNVAPGSPEQKAYNKAVGKWYQQRSKLVSQTAPILYRYNDEACVAMCITAGFLALATLFAAAGANRPTDPIERDPNCECCGYNLTGLTTDGACPECGQSIIESVGENIRLGPPWERAAKIGHIRAWFQTARISIFDPSGLGKSLKTQQMTNAHQSFFGWTMSANFAFTALVLSVFMLIVENERMSQNDWEFILFGVPLISFVISLAQFVFLQLATLNIGFRYSWRNKKNLLGATSRATSYCSAYLIVWTILVSLTGILAYLIYLKGILATIFGFYGTDTFVAAGWGITILILLLIQQILITRAVQAAQYANT